jgi:hypothetical protein
MKPPRYQVIAPPFTLQFRDMTNAEAKAYGEWFLGTLTERIHILSESVKATPGYASWEPDFSPDSLRMLGEWFEQIVGTRPRSPQEFSEIRRTAPGWFQQVEISDVELTDETFSVAVDIGMYLAEVLLRNVPTIRWRMHRGKRIDVDHAQPVLEGFGHDFFNPVQMMVTLAYGLARRTKTGSRLRELYDIWSRYAASAVTKTAR